MEPNEPFQRVNPDLRDFSAELESFLKTRELGKFRTSFVEKMTILIISAFGLIAALAWDEALKELFQNMFGHLNDLEEKFLYAGSITVIAVLISLTLSKIVLKK